MLTKSEILAEAIRTALMDTSFMIVAWGWVILYNRIIIMKLAFIKWIASLARGSLTCKIGEWVTGAE